MAIQFVTRLGKVVKGGYPLVGIRIPATRPPGVRLLTDEIAKSECDVERYAPPSECRVQGTLATTLHRNAACSVSFGRFLPPGGREFFEEIVQTLESVGCKHRLPVEVVSAVVPLG